MDTKSVRSKFQAEIVTVLVGKDENRQKFAVHKPVLEASSDFFRKALSKTWKKKKDEPLLLPEDDPDIFALYVEACYSGSISDDLMITESFRENARLYVLADKWMNIGIKNLIAKKIFGVGYCLWRHVEDVVIMANILDDAGFGECKLMDLLAEGLARIEWYEMCETDRRNLIAALKMAPSILLAVSFGRSLVPETATNINWPPVNSYLEAAPDKK